MPSFYDTFSPADEKRFWSKVAIGKPNECWLWTAGKMGKYGEFWFKDRPIQAHRFAFLLVGNRWPTMKIQHQCKNLSCCNPQHLFECKPCVHVSRTEKPELNPVNVRRFWEKVNVGSPNECWLWQSNIHGNGYGLQRIGFASYCAHRLAYLITKGVWPGVLCVCHKCDNPLCCNPGHLFLGTPNDNRQDCVKKKRHNTGERNGGAKLTEKQVRQVRAMHAQGRKRKDIARLLGVHTTTIRFIAIGKTWKTCL